MTAEHVRGELKEMYRMLISSFGRFLFSKFVVAKLRFVKKAI